MTSYLRLGVSINYGSLSRGFRDIDDVLYGLKDILSLLGTSVGCMATLTSELDFQRGPLISILL